MIRVNDPMVYQGLFEKFEYNLAQPTGYTLETLWQAPDTARIVFTRMAIRIRKDLQPIRFVLPGVCWLAWRSQDPTPGWTILDAVEWLSHDASREENIYSRVSVFFSNQPMSEDMIRVLLN